MASKVFVANGDPGFIRVTTRHAANWGWIPTGVLGPTETYDILLVQDDVAETGNSLGSCCMIRQARVHGRVVDYPNPKHEFAQIAMFGSKSSKSPIRPIC